MQTRRPWRTAPGIRAGLPPARHGSGVPLQQDPITDSHRYAGHFNAASRSGPSAGLLRSVVESTRHALSATGAGDKSPVGRLVAHRPRIAQPFNLASVDAGAGWGNRTRHEWLGRPRPDHSAKPARSVGGLPGSRTPLPRKATDLQSAAVTNAARNPHLQGCRRCTPRDPPEAAAVLKAPVSRDRQGQFDASASPRCRVGSMSGPLT